MMENTDTSAVVCRDATWNKPTYDFSEAADGTWSVTASILGHCREDQQQAGLAQRTGSGTAGCKLLAKAAAASDLFQQLQLQRKEADAAEAAADVRHADTVNLYEDQEQKAGASPFEIVIALKDKV